MRRVFEVGEHYEDSVNAVQAGRRHLSNTPRPMEDLSGTQHSERVRLLGNDAEQAAQILEVV